MGRMGRPEKEIDEDVFTELCKIHATKNEICTVMKVSDKTLDKWAKKKFNCTFSDLYKERVALGNASLRRMQMKLAEKNATMAIFLGKQYLGQSDNPEQEKEESIKVVINV